jgi:hypothetical protein
MTPLRFTGDLINFYHVMGYGGDVQSKARRMICTVERVFLTVVTYLVLDALRERITELNFRVFIWVVCPLLPEAVPGVALYCVLQGGMQLKAFYFDAMEVSTTIFMGGVGNILAAMYLDVRYQQHLDKVIQYPLTIADCPPLLSRTIYELHEKVVPILQQWCVANH